MNPDTPDETPTDERITTPADFWFRKTGFTGTIVIKLETATGERFQGSATADLEPEKFGEGVAILAGKAALLFNASAGVPIDIDMAELYDELGLQAPEDGDSDA